MSEYTSELRLRPSEVAESIAGFLRQYLTHGADMRCFKPT
jgi:hypothetical protein